MHDGSVLFFSKGAIYGLLLEFFNQSFKLLEGRLPEIYTLIKIKHGKLGQRQSQTPISSAFWVQKDFGFKKCWVQKKFGSKKIVCPKKFGPSNFGSNKCRVQKMFGQKNVP